jgi:hypothetical protein
MAAIFPDDHAPLSKRRVRIPRSLSRDEIQRLQSGNFTLLCYSRGLRFLLFDRVKSCLIVH